MHHEVCTDLIIVVNLPALPLILKILCTCAAVLVL